MFFGNASTQSLLKCLLPHPSIKSSPVFGNTFTNTYKDWEEGTYEKFKEFAAIQFGEKDRDSDEEAEVPVHLQKAKDIVFKKDKRGIFVLPPLTDYKNIQQKQRVVRGYIGAVYSELLKLSFFSPFNSNNRGFYWIFVGSLSLHPCIRRWPNDILTRFCP